MEIQWKQSGFKTASRAVEDVNLQVKLLWVVWKRTDELISSTLVSSIHVKKTGIMHKLWIQFSLLIVLSSYSMAQGLPFSLSEVTWLHPAVGHWPVTSNLDVRVHGPYIDLNFDKTREWKSIDLAPGEADPKSVNANPWVFVNLSGNWYAGTFEWIRPGSIRKHKYSVNGDHIKVPPLNTWSPLPGETYYFMVSGLARQGHKGSHERTNVVAVKWPGGSAGSVSMPAGPGGAGSGSGSTTNGGSGPGPSTGGTGSGTPGGPANPPAAGGSTQTLFITCKSGKTLGIFKKKRICGGELFSKLTSYKFVEQIGTKHICKEGKSFGVHKGHAIWVKGCKGRFQVQGIPKAARSVEKVSEAGNVPRNDR